MTAPTNLLTVWADVLLASFVAAGVRDVVLSPGSRSTPFVLAAVRQARLRLHDIIDERAAAFFALGQARRSGRPSLLLCTSGTAAAHYLPAIIEASQAGVPLIALTADRPFELQACAAPQTIDQSKLYGDQVRAFFELGLPDESAGALRALRRVAAQAVHGSLYPQPGAVHVNARARKPLEPQEASDEASRALEARAAALLAAPITVALTPRRCPRRTDLALLADALQEAAGEGLLVCGPASLAQGRARAALYALAAATGLPLCSEAPSQLRLGPAPPGVNTVDAFDLLLRQPRLRRALRPRLILQIGAPPTASSYEQLLEAQDAGVTIGQPRPRRIVIAPELGWPDPQSSADALVLADLDEVLEGLLPLLPPPPPAGAQTRLLRRAEALAQEALSAALGADAAAPLSEGAAVRAVVAAQPAGAVLMIGNSLPIREVDLYGQRGPEAIAVLAQRGANGIDGLVAGAAGAASQGRGPLTLLLGDISLQHDLTSLGLCGAPCAPLLIVVINNGGGRIFAQLPIGRSAGAALAHFTTPHELRFEAAARLYGLRYACTSELGGLRAALTEALSEPAATLLEVRVAPESAAQDLARVSALLTPGLAALLDAHEARS